MAMRDDVRFDDTAFAIRFDTGDKLLDIEVRGHWDIPTVARFGGAVATMVSRLPALGCPLGQQVTLFDMTGFAVQSQDVLPPLQKLAADPGITSRRIAIVTASALLKMQAKRIAPHFHRFDDRAAAIEWLMENDPA